MTPAQITDLRENRLGWSQQRLAEELGVTQATISRIETGVKKPSGPVKRLLAQLDASTEGRAA